MNIEVSKLTIFCSLTVLAVPTNCSSEICPAIVTILNDDLKLPSRAHNDLPLLAAMRPLASGAGPALRSWTKHSFPVSPTYVASAVVRAQQRRSQSEYVPTSSFESPFKGAERSPTTKIPSFKNYMSKSSETSNRVFQYFMVGSLGLLTAAGAKATVQGEKNGEQGLQKTVLSIEALQEDDS